MKRNLRAVSQGTTKKLEEGTTAKGMHLIFAELLLAGLFATTLSLFAAPTSVQAQDRSDCLKSPVMPQGGSGMTGGARLCFSADGVRVRILVHNLVPGRAYTVWFVYFDDPAKCITAPGTANPCGPPDLIKPVPSATDPNAAPAGVFGRMDSAVADEVGEAMFSGKLQDFHVSPGSHVHLGIFVHDPASDNNQVRARQLLTPENAHLGFPGLGLATQRGFLAGAAIFHIPS